MRHRPLVAVLALAVALGAASLLASAPSARAQEGPPAGAPDGSPPGSQTPPAGAPSAPEGPAGDPTAHHPAPAPAAGAAAVVSEEKGPNLQVPATVQGPARETLEAAIAAWEGAYAAYQKTGARARPQVDAAITKLHAARTAAAPCAIPDHYLGIAYQLTGEFDQAITRLREAVRKNPRFHEAMVELGDAYRWAKRDSDAEKAYDDAVRAAPDYAHAYKMRALLRVGKERFEEARADIRRARELKPKDAELAGLGRQLDLVLDGPPWPRKFEAETRNYVVRTNVDQALADDIAKHVELIRRLYEQIFPKPSRSKRKFPIIVFASKEEYHRNGGPAGAGGHFDPAFKQLFLFKYPKDSDTKLVLFHEGFHQFLDALEVEAPQWFNEGLADFFGPSQYVNERGTEGMRIRPNPWRLDTVKQMIRANTALPFERLMTMTQAEMYAPEVAGQCYAQAWSICYFLAQADDRAHFEYLKDYFQALRRGKGLREAYQSVFGRADMAAMEQRWREYMLGVQ